MRRVTDEKGNRRRGSLVPRLDMETERPPAGGDGDAYSAATVVRSLPNELLVELAALRPQRVPKLDLDASGSVEPSNEVERPRADDAPPLAPEPRIEADPEDAPAPADLTLDARDDPESSERPAPLRTGTRGSHAALTPASETADPVGVEAIPATPKSRTTPTLVVALVIAFAVGAVVYGVLLK